MTSPSHQPLQQYLVRTRAQAVVTEYRPRRCDRLVEAFGAQLFGGKKLESLQPCIAQQRALGVAPWSVVILLQKVVAVESKSRFVVAASDLGACRAPCRGDKLLEAYEVDLRSL